MDLDGRQGQCIIHGASTSGCQALSEDQDRYYCMFQRINGWLDACLEGHSKCAENLSPAHLCEVFPTRLIHVGTLIEPQARLIKFTSRESFATSEHGSCHPGYATLSYRWGQIHDTSYLLRLENELEFMLALPSVPRTIRDAMVICRQLRIRYLWCDAICILQGHDEKSSDWEKESARVGSYYSNALLTIAAATSASSNAGCLPTKVQKEIVTFKSEVLRARSEIDGGMLLTRGWVFQEITLSKRVLWLSDTGSYWNCHGLFEDFGLGSNNFPEAQTLYSERAAIHYWKSPLLFSRGTRDTRAWYSYMELYSGMQLSRVCDRLPALSSLSRYTEPTGRDQYLAGLWRSTIRLGLAWRVEWPVGTTIPVEKPDYLPTWSFLRVQQAKQKIKFYWAIDKCRYGSCTGQDFQMETEVINLLYDDPYGHISGATLCLRAFFLDIIYKRAILNSLSIVDRTGQILKLPQLHAEMFLDDPAELVQEDEIRCKAMVLGHRCSPEVKDGWFICLCLEEVAPDTFRRIGILRADNSDRLFLQDVFAKGFSKVVTLV